MAYSLRDIIKQRTGEIASTTDVAPTIFKLSPEDKWHFSTNIVRIGEIFNDLDPNSFKNFTDEEISNLTDLPNWTYVKQVGSSVKGVNRINIEGDIIPPNIFKYAINLENVSNCFYKNEIITEIPKGLLKNCTKLIDASSMFKLCKSLKTIPEDLFASCPDIEEFIETFAYCESLEEIPENLFANNKNVKFFNSTFIKCISLKTIPENLFANNQSVWNFEATFYGCKNLRGEAPKLWELYNSFYKNSNRYIRASNCFYGCNNLANYSEIWCSWK